MAHLVTDPELKRQLEVVMALQDDIVRVEEDIVAAEDVLHDREAGSMTREHLRQLRATQADLLRRAENLYAALKVEEVFPNLMEYGAEFAKALVMAYDAKCILRHKLIGRFFEWHRLDRAVGGIGAPLGTRIIHVSYIRTLSNHIQVRRHTSMC